MKVEYSKLKNKENSAFTKEKNKNILFLHGYLSSGKSFFKQLDFFSREFNVFAPDLKGFGDNVDMPYPYSLSDYINEVEEYKYKHGISCPHVIAHSFGGRIVIKSASQNTNAFDKIVLTGSAGLKPKFSFKKQIKKSTFNLLKKFVNKEKLKGFYSKDYLSLSPTMQQSFIKVVNEHLDDKLCKIDNSTLIINGAKDKETPLYMAKKLNKNIKNSKLVILKDAGHFAFLDCPYKFNLEVKEFLLS